MTMSTTAASLQSLTFDNRFVGELPADPQSENYRRQVTGACYSRVKPTSVAEPRLVSCSFEAAGLIDLTAEECTTELFAQIFAGNQLLPEMDPYAMCYGGHQFGNWAGQLGDGRAINLGEVINARGQRWILQLKGAGPTPYSRQADGLAVLRSSIREFLCSEAMHHLGIPTTRALSVITTGELVERDMFYDGRIKEEPGAVVCRMSPSFLRFGNYEILAARGETDLLQRLVDYTLRTDFPHLGGAGAQAYIDWFHQVCRTTAQLIVHWMRVGFVHGVMNTDNMSILGLTIDYGPYGWLEGYQSDWTPNTTDAHGRRYSYANQPQMGQWNLVQLANAIYPLIKDVKPLQEALSEYNRLFLDGWNDMMAAKIGLDSFVPHTDDRLIGELVDILQLTETDMTIFFRKLAEVDAESVSEAQEKVPAVLLEAYYSPEETSGDYCQRFFAWLRDYRLRLQSAGESEKRRRERMNGVNPKYVLRNYLAQMAIDKAEEGDNQLVGELLDLLKNPYDEQPDRQHFAAKRPEWARNRPGCSMLSCSS